MARFEIRIVTFDAGGDLTRCRCLHLSDTDSADREAKALEEEENRCFGAVLDGLDVSRSLFVELTGTYEAQYHSR